MVLALLLTLGKGGWAMALGGVVFLAVTRGRSREWTQGALFVLTLTTATGLLAIAALIEVAGIDSGLRMHLAGLAAGVDAALASPLGHGLGTSGVFSSQPTSSSRESMLGVLLAQLGWLGAALWALWILAAAVAAARFGLQARDTGLIGLASSCALVLVLPAAALTESVGGLVGTWALAFVPGILVNEGLAVMKDRQARSADTSGEPEPVFASQDEGRALRSRPSRPLSLSCWR